MMHIRIRSMQWKILGAALVLCLTGAMAGAQAPTQDMLDMLKNLSQDQQGSLLQSIMGKGGTGTSTSTKTDNKLSTPETVQPTNGQTELEQQVEKKQKTLDGRTLRQSDENPELRADDTVLIDVTPIDDVDCSMVSNGSNSTAPSNASINGAAVFGNGNGNGNGNGTVTPGAKANTNGNLLGGLVGSGAATGGTLDALSLGAANSAGNSRPASTAKTALCNRLAHEKPRTDEEKDQAEKFAKRIMSGNPYRLNRFGVLEVPGLPSIPLAGLTADEATTRLSSDPELLEYDVELSLLRLQPYGQEALKPFGYDLFEGVPSTFAPVSDIQVPMDYVIGPGDTFNITTFGNESSTYTLTVERDGRVNFPKLGPILVSGMPFDQARAIIEQRVAKQLIGTRVSVTMGDLRSIRVFVLGEAEKPGSYTVSGLSTMTNALFVSGGVKKIGSLRNIELKRDGKLITVLDLYDLLLHGDTSGDRQLMPGDVIFIPPIGNTVSVDGAVRRPAIYELKNEKDVEQAVNLAGGLLPDADQKIVQLERILPSRLREMQDVNLTDTAGRTTSLANGDKLVVPAIRPTLENSVTLSGYVFRPGQFEFHAGLRLSNILGSFDELRPNADLHYIMIRRETPPEERVEVISADLQRALAGRGSAADPELHPRDQIIVFDLSATRDRLLAPIIRTLELQAGPDNPEQVVSIDGRVKAPGHYPLEPSMHVSDLLRAGGSLEDSAYRGDAELTRYQVVDGNARETELIPVNLTAIRHGDASADLQLRPYDVLVVKPIPMWEEPGTIELKGEVRFPGKYPIHQGETLYSVMQRAGGFTDAAFPEGVVYLREELKKREKDQLDLLSQRLQTDLAALSLEAVASSAATANSNGGASAGQALVVGQQLLQQLRDAKPVGRLVIDVDQVIKGRAGAPGDVIVRDGDTLLIPKKTQEVTILGEVQSPTSHVYRAGMTRDDYIAMSGGTTKRADHSRIYVVRANGNVVTGAHSGWFRRSHDLEMRPGDTIVVPLDTERVNALPIWQAVTTIIYNLAIAFLAIHNVSN
jgi:protein involved in polysaccharide export with SLBB domain